MDNLLHFQRGNSKIKYMGTLVMSLPAGHTCPGAEACKAMADRDSGKLINPNDESVQFRCYAASIETYARSYRAHCWNNHEMLDGAGSTDAMVALILDSIDAHHGVSRIRLHGGGDFYCPEYLKAWVEVADQRPDLLIYGYTKSLTYLSDVFASYDPRDIPSNFRMIMSQGGKYDNMIDRLQETYPDLLRVARVVMHPEEADKARLTIDHDDETAALGTDPEFALLIHGSQPAGSDASTALKRLRKEGVKYGY